MNLDGAAELARGTEVDPFAALERRPALRGPLAALATPRGAILERDAAATGLAGRAFLPTPGALKTLARAGAILPDAPPLSVLRDVNHRAFALGLEGAAASAWCTEAARAASLIHATHAGAPLRLKRAFAFAGRGHLRIDRATSRDLIDRFVARAIDQDGGLVIEREVELLLEVAIHGFIPHRGGPTFGHPTVQRVSAAGVWQESVVADATSLRTGERQILKDVGERAAHALIEAGYHGPFGLDAYRYRHQGHEGFRPISDLNARYTMGFAVGMGDRRPDLD